MDYDYILIRYGELNTKGKNRNEFIKRLYKNLKLSLKDFKNLSFERNRDRTFIKLNGEDVTSVCKKLDYVFGFSSYSLASKVKSELSEITAEVLKQTKNKKGTFKIVTRRRDKMFPYNSDQINRECAAVVLKNTELKVSVTNPDFKVLIEVDQEMTSIMVDQIKGPSGFPVGTQGKALLLLSGGIDSPVAGYLTQKRGVVLQCIHFESQPYTSPQSLIKVQDLAKKLSYYQGNVRIHIVPFTKIQMKIHEVVDESYRITIMRRMMIRIAVEIAKLNSCLALVTGESVGQVASQTLESINTINAVTSFPILRPLLSFDKLDIINYAKKIETYDISILPYEDCCTIFTPVAPVIKPTVRKAEYYENKFNFSEMIAEAIVDTEIYNTSGGK